MQTHPKDPRDHAVSDEQPQIRRPRPVLDFPRRLANAPKDTRESVEHVCVACQIALAFHWNGAGDWIGCYGAIEKASATLQQTTPHDLEARILDHCVIAAGGKLARFLHRHHEDVDQVPDVNTLQTREVRLVREIVQATLAIARQCQRHGVPPVTHPKLRQALDSAEGEG